MSMPCCCTVLATRHWQHRGPPTNNASESQPYRRYRAAPLLAAAFGKCVPSIETRRLMFLLVHGLRYNCVDGPPCREFIASNGTGWDWMVLLRNRLSPTGMEGGSPRFCAVRGCLSTMRSHQ
mmetsp:Transcript_8288/g.17271  ORF Transcript_8288/g.17271 Transcript_8288/m.17271 type:complete len:122 (-) Transcript_8288:847-1212(-)